MNELIKKLQDKTYVRAFGLMSKEEQECYEEVGIKNCIIVDHDGQWNAPLSGLFARNYTYCIKSDYAPIPKYVILAEE